MNEIPQWGPYVFLARKFGSQTRPCSFEVGARYGRDSSVGVLGCHFNRQLRDAVVVISSFAGGGGEIWASFLSKSLSSPRILRENLY
jgi:hypothetical protein